MNLEDLRIDCAIKQKRGIHFISASIVIWLLVMMVQFLDLPISYQEFANILLYRTHYCL